MLEQIKEMVILIQGDKGERILSRAYSIVVVHGISGPKTRVRFPVCSFFIQNHINTSKHYQQSRFIFIEEIKKQLAIYRQFLLLQILQLMKQQFEQSREGLISHIELKLSQLKQQRDLAINEFDKPQSNGKIKISNYLQNQTNIKPQPVKAKNTNFDVPQVFSNADMLQHRLEAKEKCQQLKQLYERKRQLQQAGIYEANPNQIKKLYQNKEAVDKIKKDIIKNKKKELDKIEKQKIIQQELSKVQSFLQQSKRTAKVKNLQSQYRYNQLLKEQRQKLSKYEQLLNKKRLSLSQKQELLEMTFRLIKQYPQRVSKQYLQQFLLANHQFCKLFYITKEQIMRDLKVHKTAQNQYLTYQQFYQFIKSVQITNQALKPNLNYVRKQKDIIINKAKDKGVISKAISDGEEIQKYLKKLFTYLDQKRQRIVQRSRIQIALTKSMLFDQKKMNFGKDILSKLGQFIVSQRKREESKKYYKQLDLKYIGIDQLIQLYHKYNDKQKQAQVINISQFQQQQQSNYQQQDSALVFQLKQVKQAEPQQVDTKTDFQKYGWEETQVQKQQFSHLSQLDHYYKEMTNKYGNQIHWNNYNVYQEDFKKFNQAISKMKQNHNSNSREVVGLFIRQPVLQVSEDSEEID